MTNQLLFNPLVPYSSSNMIVDFKSHPQSVVIEKLPCEALPVPRPTSAKTITENKAFSFSTLSEERLSSAELLAKRDFKKMKELNISVSVNKNKQSKVNRSRKPKEMRFTEQKTQPNKLTSNTQNVASKLKVTSAKSSGISSSIPPKTSPNNAQDESRTIEEINRLEVEIQKCIIQINKIEQQAKKGVSVFRSLSPDLSDLPQEEREKQLASRQEQQAIRSARLIYSLKHKVKDICNDVNRQTSFNVLSSNKKSHLISQLAMAHRSIIKALQSYIIQLSNWDFHKEGGMPHGYQDLILVIRKLLTCCFKINLIDDEHYKKVINELPATHIQIYEKDKFYKNVPENSQKDLNKRPEFVLKNLNDNLEKTTHNSQYSNFINRNKVNEKWNNSLREGSSVSPDRLTSLRAGLMSLIHVDRKRPSVKRCINPNVYKSKRIYKYRSFPPSHLKHSVQQQRKSRLISEKIATQYLKPTLSSKIKITSLQVKDSDHPSPKRKERSKEFKPAIVKKEEKRKICIENNSDNQNSGDILKSHEQTSNIEKPKVKKPIIPKESNDELYSDLSFLSNTTEDTNSVQVESDLSDQILNKLMQQTTLYGECNKNIQISNLFNCPTDLDQMLVRLNEMEQEQNEIRKRWTTITYKSTPGVTNGRTPGGFQISKDTNLNNLLEQTEDGQLVYNNPSKIYADQNQINSTSYTYAKKLEEKSIKTPEAIEIKLTEDFVQKIQSSKDEFAKLIKDNNIFGKYNPRMMIDYVSDELLDECMTEIAKELEEINNEIVQHVYKSEFVTDPSLPSPPRPVSPDRLANYTQYPSKPFERSIHIEYNSQIPSPPNKSNAVLASRSTVLDSREQSPVSRDSMSRDYSASPVSRDGSLSAASSPTHRSAASSDRLLEKRRALPPLSLRRSPSPRQVSLSRSPLLWQRSRSATPPSPRRPLSAHSQRTLSQISSARSTPTLSRVTSPVSAGRHLSDHVISDQRTPTIRSVYDDSDYSDDSFESSPQELLNSPTRFELLMDAGDLE